MSRLPLPTQMIRVPASDAFYQSVSCEEASVLIPMIVAIALPALDYPGQHAWCLVPSLWPAYSMFVDLPSCLQPQCGKIRDALVDFAHPCAMSPKMSIRFRQTLNLLA